MKMRLLLYCKVGQNGDFINITCLANWPDNHTAPHFVIFNSMTFTGALTPFHVMTKGCQEPALIVFIHLFRQIFLVVTKCSSFLQLILWPKMNDYLILIFVKSCLSLFHNIMITHFGYPRNVQHSFKLYASNVKEFFFAFLSIVQDSQRLYKDYM